MSWESEPHFSNACEWQCLIIIIIMEKKNFFLRNHNGINFQMVGTRKKSTQAAQSDSNVESVLGQILTAIEGLAQASENTNFVVQNMVQRSPGMVAENGVLNLAAGPSNVPDGDQGSAQGWVGLADPGERGKLPNPVPPVVRQVVLPTVDHSDQHTVEKFWKNGAEVFIGWIDPMKVES